MSGELPVPEPLAPLDELYRCVLSADCPSLSPADTACLLRSCLGAHGTGVSALEPGCESACAPELQCVGLTVLEQLLCRLTVGSGGPEFHLFAEESWSLLQSDVVGALLQLFHSEDLLVSHLSVMCVSAVVLHQLHQTGLVSSEWSQWCHQALGTSPHPLSTAGSLCPTGHPVDACVRSLTEVLRRLLKGGHYELAEKVLVGFDCTLSAFCSQLLSVDTGTGCGGWGASVSLLLDLLEVLCACRSLCEQQGAALSGQCLLCLCTSKLLALCSSPLLQPEPAVRRRVLVLLKKALVQKAGEDWTGGQSGLRCNDVSLLANSVLRVAAGGGLKGVRVEGESFFGGTVGSGPSVDNVTLRALCLVLLKAMELQCQPSQLVSHAELVPFHLCLQSLWDVLPADPVAHPSGQPHHCCSRLSSVFGEQDDDMIEAAKALLSIFLHHRKQEPALSPTPHPLWACSLGLNPHCHFLLLLRSLAFDHRVLLDFLISTETCFLEYFVCYLRLLRTDPEGFSAACSEPRTEWGTRGSERTECAEGVGQNCGVLLVDYSSSGESETEEAEGAVNCGRDQDRGSCWGAAVRCLSLLLELMSRLHSKNLFPYNPSSLMKLLTEAEASLKSVPIKQ
ncbi:protein Lines homolog 1 [Periophthalmus magnuspinnatus]|uniref:protein Lines homolog 1 n=1 Tax=Periophthalmus magnuspinnatus TaxID=409849 RepID=UPI00145A3B08|nr:protein Lines homolog 1 [Periophthalmus magnuspinnatus]